MRTGRSWISCLDGVWFGKENTFWCFFMGMLSPILKIMCTETSVIKFETIKAESAQISPHNGLVWHKLYFPVFFQHFLAKWENQWHLKKHVHSVSHFWISVCSAVIAATCFYWNDSSKWLTHAATVLKKEKLHKGHIYRQKPELQCTWKFKVQKIK